MQTPDSLRARITISPAVLAGKPTIRGLRISVQQLLRALAAGQTRADLLREYPELEPDDFAAALLYAADVIAGQRVYQLSA